MAFHQEGMYTALGVVKHHDKYRVPRFSFCVRVGNGLHLSPFTGDNGSIKYATTCAICSGVRNPFAPRRGMLEQGMNAQAL